MKLKLLLRLYLLRINMKLRDYQEEAVSFAKQRRFSYLGIPCRGGKTLTALTVVNDCKKVLIVCPPSLYHIWVDEIIKIYGCFIGSSIYLFDKRKEEEIPHKFVIISYEKATQVFYKNIISKLEFDSFIVDEAHRLKNYSTKRTQALIGWKKETGFLLDPKFKRGVLLSGTPMMQRPVELYAPMRGLVPELLGETFQNFKNYAFRYCQAFVDPWFNIVANGAENMDELAGKAKDFLFLVDKERVYKYFPPIEQVIVRIDVKKELIEEERKYHRESLDKNKVAISRPDLAALQHKMSLEKVDLAVDYISNLLDNGEKVLIFCIHIDVLNLVRTKLEIPLYICGEVPKKQRPLIGKLFQENDSQKALICQIATVGEGFNFSKANHVVFVEFSWNPGDIEQCYKRAYMADKKQPLLIHYIVATNSLDDHRLNNVINKEEMVDGFSKILLELHKNDR